MMILKGRENCASRRENLRDETLRWQKIRQRFNPFYALIEAPVVAGAGKGSPWGRDLEPPQKGHKELPGMCFVSHKC